MPLDAVSEATRPQTQRTVTRARAPSGSRRTERVTDWLQARAMFVIAVSAVLIISLLGIPTHLNQDGWLALVGGRLVAAHGIPQHDYFASLTYGAQWVDQQWLAQLLMYEVVHIGGLQLLGVLYVLVAIAGFGGAVAAARRLGAEDLYVLMATLPGAFFYLATALSIRTQGFAYPLFVVTLWLIASDLRGPARGRRVYWVLPVLVLWGNLHGSVTLGVGIAVLYGLVLLFAGAGRSGVRGLADARGLAFLVLSPLTLMVTPYGTGMVHYLRTTLMNPEFSRMVTEWKPVTSVPILALPLFVTIAVTLFAVARVLVMSRAGRAARPSLFEVLTLLALAAGAVMVVRNITWFGLGLIVLLPTILTQMRGGVAAPLRRSRTNRVIAITMVALAVVTMVAILGRPSSWFTSRLPAKAIPTLRALIARDPHAKILADVRYADWLIWEDPKLFSGRVAYDTSFELLARRQLSTISDLSTRSARTLVDEFPIWMLYPGDHRVDRILLHRPRVHLVRRSHAVILALNGAASRT